MYTCNERYPKTQVPLPHAVLVAAYLRLTPLCYFPFTHMYQLRTQKTRPLHSLSSEPISDPQSPLSSTILHHSSLPIYRKDEYNHDFLGIISGVSPHLPYVPYTPHLPIHSKLLQIEVIAAFIDPFIYYVSSLLGALPLLFITIVPIEVPLRHCLCTNCVPARPRFLLASHVASEDGFLVRFV